MGIFECRALSALVLAVLPLSAAHAQYDDWLRLPKTGPWVMDYAQDSCALRSLFGEEGQQVYLELRQYQPGEAMQLIVSSDDLRRSDRGFSFRSSRGVTANFIPDSEPHDHGRPMPIAIDGYGEGYISQIGILTAEERRLDTQLTVTQGVDLAITQERREERENEITGLAVGRAFNEDFVLETGEMRSPMNAMRTCMDELLTHWGIDAEAHKSLVRRVRPLEIESWARRLQEEYPRDMLYRGEQAIVNIRLTVDESGRPSDCAVQNSLNEPTFDELACEMLLRHARFESAIAGNGEPIASYWVTRVIYTIG
ncbi:TonB family protein [Aurantiacibacter hainanensis]|uniref:TonB family protein n=1 Tax=Aurantiacibacter hainanensis TaxID=3076114 RepID=UPI0030C73BA0